MNHRSIVSALRRGLVVLAFTVATSTQGHGVNIVHTCTFDMPMSWADDVSPWGLSEIQKWEISDGGCPGKALRISAEPYQQPRSFEGRTLQFNHKPGTAVKISFDIRAASRPSRSSFVVRHFDGYCGGLPFVKMPEDPMESMPDPIWDSREAGLSRDWEHVEFTTPKLKHTVLTLCFLAKQPLREEGQYIDYFLDNLRVEVTPLAELTDPGFDWRGNYGESTFHWWHNAKGKSIDWCDYADQETIKDWQGNDLHFTLQQFRESSAYKGPASRHKVAHVKYSTDVGCKGAVELVRLFAGDNSAVSWGKRQTFSYDSLGLSPHDEARIQVRMKYTNNEWYNQQMTRVQLGVDPMGGLITGEALWTKEYYGVFRLDGKWEVGCIEFDKPKGARAMTIYFRHRDGAGKPAPTTMPHENNSKGTHFPASGIADWVTVKVVDRKP